jgi:hypothetical protein
MAEPSYDMDEQPLPRGWLPEASAPRAAPEWDIQLQRILAAAEPSLQQIECAHHTDVTWSMVLGSWWRSAAAIAAAAVLLLLLDRTDTAGRASAADALPLSVMVAAGEPFALWESLGIAADPVLALITLQQGR